MPDTRPAMIADPQLARLFRAESDEHLARLDAGLLQLEKTPADPALLEELFREVHSFKGAARMLGLLALEHTAHELESLLNAARRAETALDASALEALDTGLKRLYKLSAEALAGGVAALPPASIAEAPPPAPPAPASARQSSEAGSARSPAPPSLPRTAAAPPSAEALARGGGETVRVETGKLDELLDLTTELGVLAGRVLHRSQLLDELREQWTLIERSRRRLRAGLREDGDAAQARALRDEENAVRRADTLLRAAQRGLRDDAAQLATAHAALQERVHGARLLPLAGVFGLFPRMVRELAREAGKEVELRVEGGEISLDKHIVEEIKDPLMHLLRNALWHGIEPPLQREQGGKPRAGRLLLHAERSGEQVFITVRDDGRGLDVAAIRDAALRYGGHDEATLAALSPTQLHQLVFLPGLSTESYVTEVAGRGVGLDVVRAKVEQLKGGVQLESAPGAGVAVTLRLPLRLTSLRLLLLQAGGRRFGVPVDCVHSLRRLPLQALRRLEGRPVVDFDGRPLPLPSLAELLDLNPTPSAPARALDCVVLRMGADLLGLQVDAVLSEEEVVPRPLGWPLRRLPCIAAVAPLASGALCPVLDPGGLQRAAAQLTMRPEPAAPALPVSRPVVLLAEDTALVRAMEKRILEDAGYEVVTAVDGADALAKLATRPFAAVVSDIQMPNLDGLGLTARLRTEPRYRELPVVLVSALASDADRLRGLEVGANAYIPKPSFDQQLLVDTLRRLI